MTEPPLVLRDARDQDAPRIAAIYAHYVSETVVTFEVDPVDADQIATRMMRVRAAGLPWLVVEQDGVAQGFAYAAPFRERTAYRHSVETTVYMAQDAQGRGLGGALYAALLDALRALDLHLAVALIAMPNEASVALHQRLGYRLAGTLTEVGRKFDRWIDVAYWQITLERDRLPGE